MDKVKLYAQERLDLDDTRALQSLVYDYVQEAIGGLIGHMRGLLSLPTITQTENGGAPYIELTPFQFVTTTPIESSGQPVSTPSTGTAFTQHKSIIVTYVPSEQSTTQISIDTPRAYYQDYVGAYLWARPVYIDTDSASRVKWSVSGGAETVFTDNTRQSQRVEFAIQKNEPAYDSATEAKWAPLLRIRGWGDGDNTDSLALWDYISAYEHDQAREWFGDAVSTDNELTADQSGLDYVLGRLSQYPMSQSRSYRGFGLADQITMLRYKIAEMQGFGKNDPADTTTARDWWASPLVSLNGADTAIQRLQGRRSSKMNCIAFGRVRVTFGTTYGYTLDTADSFGIAGVRASNVRTNRFCVELESDLLGQPWHITSVDLAQSVYRYDMGSNNYDYNRLNYMIDLGEFAGLSVPQTISQTYLNDANAYHLDDYSTTSGRGVMIELLPLFTANEEEISDLHGSDNRVNLFGTEVGANSGANSYALVNISIFAVHEEEE